MLSLALQSVWGLKVKILYERNLQNSAELGRSLLSFMVQFKIHFEIQTAFGSSLKDLLTFTLGVGRG